MAVAFGGPRVVMVKVQTPDGAQSLVHHRDTDARARLVTAVREDAVAHGTEVGMDEVDEGHAAQLVHGAGGILSATQGAALDRAVEDGVELVAVEGALVTAVYARIDIAEEIVNETGITVVHTFIIYGTEHAHIGGDGVGTATVVTEVVLERHQIVGRDVVEMDDCLAQIDTEGMTGVRIQVGGGKPTVTLQLAHALVRVLGKCF